MGSADLETTDWRATQKVLEPRKATDLCFTLSELPHEPTNEERNVVHDHDSQAPLAHSEVDGEAEDGVPFRAAKVHTVQQEIGIQVIDMIGEVG